MLGYTVAARVEVAEGLACADVVASLPGEGAGTYAVVVEGPGACLRGGCGGAGQPVALGAAAALRGRVLRAALQGATLVTIGEAQWEALSGGARIELLTRLMGYGSSS